MSRFRIKIFRTCVDLSTFATLYNTKRCQHAFVAYLQLFPMLAAITYYCIFYFFLENLSNEKFYVGVQSFCQKTRLSVGAISELQPLEHIKTSTHPRFTEDFLVIGIPRVHGVE